MASSIPLLGPCLPLFVAKDASGLPLAGGKLYTYDSGTTNPADTYSNAQGSMTNSNPIVLDANGMATIFCDYKPYTFKLTDAAGNVMPGYPVNDVNPGVYTSAIIAVSDKIDGLQDNIDTVESSLSSMETDISNLEATLANKAPLSHTHTKIQITDINTLGALPTGCIFQMKIVWTPAGGDAYMDFLSQHAYTMADVNMVDKFFKLTNNGMECLSPCSVFVTMQNYSTQFPLPDTKFTAAYVVYKNSAIYSRAMHSVMKLIVGDKLQIVGNPVNAGGVGVENNLVVSVMVVPQPVLPE